MASRPIVAEVRRAIILPPLSEIMRPAGLLWTALYIGLIVLVNWLFTVVPLPPFIRYLISLTLTSGKPGLQRR